MKYLVKTIFCLLFAMFASSVFAQEEVIPGEKEYEEGEDYQIAEDYDNAIRCYKAAAELGYADAMEELADIYKDKKKDNGQAIVWYKKYLSAKEDEIARKGTADNTDSLSIAMIFYSIGDMYKEGGNGVERDFIQAVKCYEKAINYGFSYPSKGAIYDIAIKYLYGDEEEGIKEDEQQALILLNKAYNYGNALAAFDLGECYMNGWGVEKDEKTAFKYYREAVYDDEHVRAMRMLGLCYYDSRGTERDLTKAEYYMSKAAEKGDPISQRNLAWYYWQDAKKNELAFSWMKKSAENDYAQAQHELGFFYEQGIGTEVDDIQAVKWYQEAAGKGFLSSMNNLAMMYYNGKGVEQNYAIAASWARKAAEGGNAMGQLNYGEFYDDGVGVEKDEKQAFSWYLKAAEQNNAEACWRVCLMYYNGRGVKKNNDEWYRWRKKAIQLGHPKAIHEEEFFKNAQRK